MPRILIVDDDRLLARSVEKLLAAEGYFCALAGSAAEAWTLLTQPDASPFDLVVLDVGLPDRDGFSLCRQLRERYRMPILFLSARDDPADKIVGLELGADDYLAKPFVPRELAARVRAQLRRTAEYGATPAESRAITLGELVIDPDRREATVSGRSAGLTEREFQLLHLLARHRGKALSSEWIFESVWGYAADLGAKTLTVTLGRLRQKIEPDPQHPRTLITVRGFGYMLKAPD